MRLFGFEFGLAKSPRKPLSSSVTKSINALGLDIIARLVRDNSNTLVSPYALQHAMAMVYAGAAGETKAELQKALHYPEDEATLHASMARLAETLERTGNVADMLAKQQLHYEQDGGVLRLTIASQLFGQKGQVFEQTYLDLLRHNYSAALMKVDFKRDAAGARHYINRWVQKKTANRIKEILPEGSLTSDERLVLLNAIYLKAPWKKYFKELFDEPFSFWVNEAEKKQVAGIEQQALHGYAKYHDFSAVSVAYLGDELHFLVLFPDADSGLEQLEKRIDADLLADCAKLPIKEVLITLPKFKISTPVLDLKILFQSLGVKQAFDNPMGSANFERISRRDSKGYLALSGIYHRTFISVDEKGTEAAAVTAETIRFLGCEEPERAINIVVNRPFFFAIQHRTSGVCLFMGRVKNPLN